MLALRRLWKEDHEFKGSLGNIARPYLKKPKWVPVAHNHRKRGLVEWLKVKALSLSPCTAKKKKKDPFPNKR
jgi:hypothetical protein